MIKFSPYLCLLLLLSLLMGPSSSSAEQSSEQPKTKETEVKAQKTEKSESIPDPKTSGPWWRFSSLKYELISPKWLFHFAGNMAYAKLTGNIEGSDLSGSLNFALRKNRYTTHLNYTLAKTKMIISVGGATTETDNQSLLGREQIDLSKHLAVNIGMSWEKDSRFFVKNRYTYYAGLSFIVLDLPKHFLRVGGFYGFDDTQYDNLNLNSLGFPSAKELKSEGLLFEQYYHIMLTPMIILSESFEYMKIFDDDHSYRWKFSPLLSVKLSEHFSIFADYEIKEEKTPIYEDIKVAGAEKRDTRSTIGFSVNF